MTSWDLIDKDNQFIYKIINVDTIPKTFITKVREYNTSYFNQQVSNIEKTLDYISKFSNNEDYEKTTLYKQTVDRQVKLAYNWCRKYKCKINYDSEVMQNCKIPQPKRRPSYENREIKKKGVKVI